MKIKQETNFPYEEQTRLTVTDGAATFKLMVRYPEWVKDGALKITVNNKNIVYSSHPSSYISINRKWKKGDVVKVILPMHNTVEHLPNVPQYIAFLHGPILLGAKTGTENMKGLVADDSRFGQIAGGTKLPVDKAPMLVDDNLQTIADKIQPVKGQPLHFKLAVKMENPIETDLEPFYQIHDSRYMMYWLALTNAGYKTYVDSLSSIEKAKIALDKRTVDYVATGEQQPEADHKMQSDKSGKGNTENASYRDARNGGFFSYEMAINSETNLSLFVRYWGAEWGSRKFDIYIDDEKLISEDNTGKYNQSKLQDVTYAIPESMVKGKKYVRVKFQAVQGSTAGGVYGVRLVKPAVKE